MREHFIIIGLTIILLLGYWSGYRVVNISKSLTVSEIDNVYITRMYELQHSVDSMKFRILRDFFAQILCNNTEAVLYVFNGGYCLRRSEQNILISPDNYLAIDHFPADHGLVFFIVEFFKKFKNPSILELGCGQGQLKAAVSSLLPELKWVAVDGAVNVESYTSNFVQYYDICAPSPPQWKSAFDWVISLEVGEHIPPACTISFVSTLASSAREGIILSWSAEYSLPHHPNAKSNAEVKKIMLEHGFVSDDVLEYYARANVQSLYYFRSTLMVFRKVQPRYFAVIDMYKNENGSYFR